MASLKCGTCGKTVSLPSCVKHKREVIVGELNGIPSVYCPVEGAACASQPLPECCANPAYSRWI